jgi:hypothetical protein
MVVKDSSKCGETKIFGNILFYKYFCFSIHYCHNATLKFYVTLLVISVFHSEKEKQLIGPEILQIIVVAGRLFETV